LLLLTALREGLTVESIVDEVHRLRRLDKDGREPDDYHSDAPGLLAVLSVLKLQADRGPASRIKGTQGNPRQYRYRNRHRKLLDQGARLAATITGLRRDSDAHLVSHDLWKENRGKGIALYIKDGFYTAYYDDAGEMHGQADDDLPMFHVMLECDKPHRTCIHPLHLTAWVEHLASVFMPLEIVNAQMVDGEETM